MSILEVVVLVGLVMTLLFSIGVLFFLFRLIQLRKQRQKIRLKRSDSKKRKWKLLKKKQELLVKGKRSRRLAAICLCLALFFGGGSRYIVYYQSVNLTTEDGDSVARGYYLVRDFEDQLQLGKGEEIEEEPFRQNIRSLATAMASYGVKQASTVNSEEGQLLLNRYYTAVQQLGMNASTQATHFYGNPELVETFLTDIARVKEREQAVFVYYRVNESAFKEE